MPNGPEKSSIYFFSATSATDLILQRISPFSLANGETNRLVYLLINCKNFMLAPIAPTFVNNQSTSGAIVDRMKRCPTCNPMHADDTLNFCLDDGEWLVGLNSIQEPATGILSAGLPAEAQSVLQA